MRTEFKVGFFFVVGLLVLLGVFELVGEIPFLKSEYSLKAYFKSVDELKEGNPVKFSGVEVGKVSKIEIADGKIAVTFSVKEGTPVKKDSIASIRLTSLLGTSYVNLTFGSPGSPIAPPGSVLASEEPADINEILAKVQSSVTSIEAAFGALGDNKEKISSILDGLDSVLGSAARGEGTLGKLLKDDSLYYEVKGTFASINEVALSVKEGKGTLGKLVTDESLYNETKTTMQNLGELASKMNKAEGTFGKLLNDDTLYTQASEAATNLNSILEKVNNGEGTLGKLVSDDSLYFESKNAIRKLEKSVEIQEDLAPLNTLGAAFGILTIF